MMNLYGLLLIFMLPLPMSSSSSQITCTWETPNGWIDLRPLANTDSTPRFVEVEDSRGLFIYYWNPCYQFNLHSCQNTSVCQYDIKKGIYYIIGREGGSVSQGLTLQYTADTDIYRTVDILLICDTMVDGYLQFHREHPLTHYIFELHSKYACPVDELLKPLIVLSQKKISLGQTSILALPQPEPRYYYLEDITVFLLFIMITITVLSMTFVTGLGVIVYRNINNGSTKNIKQKTQESSYQYLTESDFINPSLEVPFSRCGKTESIKSKEDNNRE